VFTELRALETFNSLPKSHSTFLCTESGHEPHIRVGEYAVIDKSDRTPQHGEVYLIKYPSESLALKQANLATGVEIGRKRLPKDPRIWWLDALRKFHNTGEKIHGVPVFAGLSDGPYETHYLRRLIVGRIVGIATKSFGRRIGGKAVQS